MGIGKDFELQGIGYECVKCHCAVSADLSPSAQYMEKDQEQINARLCSGCAYYIDLKSSPGAAPSAGRTTSR